MPERLSDCPNCAAPVIPLPNAYPPRVCCSCCPYVMGGKTYQEAVAHHERRGGYWTDDYTCSRCRRRTSPTYDVLGGECLCGGTIIRTREAMAVDDIAAVAGIQNRVAGTHQPREATDAGGTGGAGHQDQDSDQ